MAAKTRIKGKFLMIELPIQEPRLSVSGKTRVLATTRGRLNTGIVFGGSEIVLVANAFIENPKGNSTQKAQRRATRKKVKD